VLYFPLLDNLPLRIHNASLMLLGSPIDAQINTELMAHYDDLLSEMVHSAP